MPLKLSDDELTAVMSACRPLDRDQRDEFLQAVAAELRKAGGAVGPGTVHRICSELQRRFILAPEIDLRSARQSKYR
jgi:predicted DNA-binding transcriptional regulator YafY